jgi:two-component system, NtrC family, response regulator HydG
MARTLEEDLATVPRAREPAQALPAFRLTVTAGPDAGLSFVVDGQAKLLVGQSQRCDVTLSDREVSRRHVAVDVTDARLHVADLGSKNGTFANGIGISAAFLHGGETVRLGGTSLRIERIAVDAPPLAPGVDRFGRLLGGSHSMRRLYPMLASVRDSVMAVLVEGETGTGKELLAEVLHETGPRAGGPFVVFDCAATPRSELESTLFGIEYPAPRPGVFEQAHGGTLLVDEVGDLDHTMQGRLAHVLERGEVQRAGGAGRVRVDVRVIATTRRDLESDVSAANR